MSKTKLTTKTMQECCIFISDGDHLSPPKANRGIPFITISNITNDNQISFDNTMFVGQNYYVNLSHTKKAKKGDILYSVVGSYGKPVYLNEDKPFIFQRHIAILRPNETISGKYLYYVMLNPYFYQKVDKLVIGCSQKTLTLDALRSIDIDIPSIAEQDKIAKLLTAIDKKIKNNNKINETLQQQASLLYDYWFTQFDFPDESGKPYKSSGGKMVWNEELKREISKGWEVKKLGSCTKHINTGLNPRDNFILNKGTIKYITVKNLKTDGTIDFTTCDTLDKQAHAIVHKRSDISKGDILFASIAPLGRCVLVQENPIDWDINESVFSIRPDREHITSEYLYMYLMSETFVKKASHSSTGSIFSGIRISTLQQMDIIIPQNNTIAKFSLQIKNILNQKYKNSQENKELAALRDWLLPMLMNGQACVIDEDNR